MVTLYFLLYMLVIFSNKPHHIVYYTVFFYLIPTPTLRLLVYKARFTHYTVYQFKLPIQAYHGARI
jgi:hypothetical protein